MPWWTFKGFGEFYLSRQDHVFWIFSFKSAIWRAKFFSYLIKLFYIKKIVLFAFKIMLKSSKCTANVLTAETLVFDVVLNPTIHPSYLRLWNSKKSLTSIFIRFFVSTYLLDERIHKIWIELKLHGGRLSYHLDSKLALPSKDHRWIWFFCTFILLSIIHEKCLPILVRLFRYLIATDMNCE